MPQIHRYIPTFATITLLVLSAGCGDGGHEPTVPGTPDPARLEIVSGASQSGPVGRPLAQPLVVRVLDAEGEPLAGMALVFEASEGSGTFNPTSVTTDAQGTAGAEWTLGNSPGPMTAQVRVDGLLPQPLSATAEPASAASMVAVTGDGQQAEVNTDVPVAPAVEVRDADGNPVRGVAVAFEAHGGGTVSPASVTTGADGRAAPDRWTLGTSAGPNVLRATTAALTDVVLEFVATGIPGQASGAQSTLSVSDDAKLTGETGVVRVVAKDAFGNPVQGVAVRLSASGSGHTLSQPTELTDDEGAATGAIVSDDVGTTVVSAMAGEMTLDQTVALSVSYGQGTQIGRTYCTINGVSSVMDVYIPSAAHPRPLPVAVHVHGGGYTSGSRSTGFWFPAISDKLLDRGYLVVSLDYRLAPAHKYPSQIEDVKCAIRYLRANADRYGLDRDHIGVWGSSAGAQLVGLMGTTGGHSIFDHAGGNQDQSSEVQAVVAMSAITDFTRTDELNDNYSAEFPTWPDPNSEELIEASPASHVSGGDSPFFFIAGADDDLVLPAQSQHMSGLLDDAGVPSNVLIIDHADHGLVSTGSPISPSSAVVITRMADFFDRYLR